MRLFGRLHDMICGKEQDCMPEAANERLSAALRAEEYDALKLAVGLRFVVCLVVLAILSFEMKFPLVLNYYGYLGAFAFSGYLQLKLREPGRDQPWMHWFFPFLDMGLIMAAVALPNPFDPYPLPPPMLLGFDTILYVALFVVLSALGQSQRIVLLTTLAAIVMWTLGTLYVATQPGVSFGSSFTNVINMPVEERVAYILDPWRVRFGEFFPRLIVIGMMGLLLTVAVTRSRHLVARQVETERARRNLSRHFSPHIAEHIAQMDDPVGEVRHIDAVVLFADLVGFTQISDTQTPAQTIAMLREVHQRLARAVAQHRGTLDKYLGDGIMASFGTPEAGPQDASAALLAARAMLQEMEDLNRQRVLQRQPHLHLAVGIHYGPLTLGNIGDETRVEYALIGETVNVAHRLEQMTRELDARVCLSQAFIDKLAQETRGDLNGLRDMVTLPPRPVRGLRDHMTVWVLRRAAPPAASDLLETAPTVH